MWPYLESLFRDVGVVELRHQDGDKWTSGYFDDLEKLLAVARKLSHEGNLFTSLNTPKFRPATNQMNGRALKNEDVLRHARLFFDFDAVRPKDTSSTEAELCEAIAAASNAEKFFTALNWPRPARAVSGNGAHLQYRVALPNDETTTELLRTIYSGLKSDLATDRVLFDSTVRNAARICVLYGSTKRKGLPTEDRPHRQSQIEIPNPWRQVTRKQIESLAKYYTRKKIKIVLPVPTRGSFVAGNGDYKSLDAVAWFRSHGI